jgi:hypothetical protein
MMIATPKRGCLIGATFEELPIEHDRDMNIEEVGETNGMAGDILKGITAPSLVLKRTNQLAIDSQA